MIDKFNFYDVYGYLIPGLVLVGVFWMPLGVFFQHWPAADLSSAILTVIFAYLLGHLIQISANVIIPSTDKDAKGIPRYASDTLLDNNSPFTPELRKQIGDLCQKYFKVEVIEAAVQPAGKSRTQIRSEAFRRARSKMLPDDKKTYAEQFEGLYAMQRGNVIALCIAACYFSGWIFVLCGCKPGNPVGWEVGLMTAALISTLFSRLTEVDKDRASESHERARLDGVRKQWEWMLAILLAGASVWGGILVAEMHPLPPSATNAQNLILHSSVWIMVLFALASLLIALRFYGSYRLFAREFASSVWRDFANLAEDSAASKKGA